MVTALPLFLQWLEGDLVLLEIISSPIDVARALAHVRNESCGAVSMFEGDIRNENNGERVVSLEYEVYAELFQKEVNKIWAEIQSRWDIHEMAVIQRVGLLQPGDAGIVICLSSAHRRDSLDGVSYAIEEFKKRVPVWKKESNGTDEKWVNWQPQGA